MYSVVAFMVHKLYVIWIQCNHCIIHIVVVKFNDMMSDAVVCPHNRFPTILTYQITLSVYSLQSDSTNQAHPLKTGNFFTREVFDLNSKSCPAYK